MKTYTIPEERCCFSTIANVIEQAFGADAEFWFRGQASAQFNLLPSIFRQGQQYGQAIDEGGMFADFRLRYPEMRQDHTTVYEWLSLMQHYGNPTRILDWSTSLAIGLYFAIDSMLETDGALYVLDSKVFNQHTDATWQIDSYYKELVQARTSWGYIRALIHELKNMFGFVPGVSCCLKLEFYNPTTQQRVSWSNTIEGKTIPVEHNILLRKMLDEHLSNLDTAQWQLLPSAHLKVEGVEQIPIYQYIDQINGALPIYISHLNARIKAQHGVFSIHGGKFINGVEVIPFQAPEKLWKDHLLKITIPSQAKAKLLKELALAGITKATVFPDMEHVAQSIKQRHTVSL